MPPQPVLGNHAVLLRLDPAANRLVFDSIIDLPGGHTKFVVRRDPVTGYYITLSNPNTDIRYTLTLNLHLILNLTLTLNLA